MKKLLIPVAALLLWACSHSDYEKGAVHSEAEEIPAVAVTQWTEKMEIFMEYETPVVGNEIKYIIHLTTMNDFRPILEGLVTLSFTDASGKVQEFTKDEILREGIYLPRMSFTKSGNYHFTVSYAGPAVEEVFDIGTIRVYDSADEIAAEEEDEGDAFGFLKEQQWKIDFATEVATPRNVRPSLRAVGTVSPEPASYAEITSPVDGVVSIAESGSLARPGQKVNPGDVLAVLVPPLAASGSWSEIYLNYEQSRSDYERARRLLEKGAISAREFELAKLEYETQKAGFAGYFDANGGSISYDSENSHFHLTAPAAGTVTEVNALPGQQVSKGQKLVTIVSQETVWLALELYAGQARALEEISGLSLAIPGQDERLYFAPGQFEVISRGEIIDQVKRTLTVWVSVDNSDRKLLVGQVFSAEVYSGPYRQQLTVPVSAVFDDNSQQTVSVHVSGESFEKRVITTGPAYFGHVAVTSGLEAGERVVTRGGYLVKLASTSEEIGHPHAH